MATTSADQTGSFEVTHQQQVNSGCLNRKCAFSRDLIIQRKQLAHMLTIAGTSLLCHLLSQIQRKAMGIVEQEGLTLSQHTSIQSSKRENQITYTV